MQFDLMYNFDNQIDDLYWKFLFLLRTYLKIYLFMDNLLFQEQHYGLSQTKLSVVGAIMAFI